jgi:putative DNA primase/helicase
MAKIAAYGGTSRREDTLDTVIALRRPEDYSPEQGARFEVHFEKLRNRVDADKMVPFEAKIESSSMGEADAIRWLDCNLRPPILKQATELFRDGARSSRSRRRTSNQQD